MILRTLSSVPELGVWRKPDPPRLAKLERDDAAAELAHGCVAGSACRAPAPAPKGRWFDAELLGRGLDRFEDRSTPTGARRRRRSRFWGFVRCAWLHLVVREHVTLSFRACARAHAPA